MKERSRVIAFHFYTLTFLLCLTEGYFDMIDVCKLKSIFQCVPVTKSPFMCLSPDNIYLQLKFTSKKEKGKKEKKKTP